MIYTAQTYHAFLFSNKINFSLTIIGKFGSIFTPVQIYARKMNVDPDINYDELAKSMDDLNGAQCKAIMQVQAKKKAIKSELLCYDDLKNQLVFIMVIKMYYKPQCRYG